MTLAYADAAARLFGPDTPPAPPVPPAAAPAAPAAPVDAAVVEDAASMARIERAFGFGAKSADAQKPADGATAKSADGATAKSADGATAKSADGATAKPGEGDAQKPADGATAKPGEGDAPQFDPASPETAIVAPVVKELGLSQTQVAKLTELRTVLQDRQAQAWGLEARTTIDAATIRVAQQAMVYAPAGLKAFLNESGLGNHPGLLRWAANMMRRTPGR